MFCNFWTYLKYHPRVSPMITWTHIFHISPKTFMIYFLWAHVMFAWKLWWLLSPTDLISRPLLSQGNNTEPSEGQPYWRQHFYNFQFIFLKVDNTDTAASILMVVLQHPRFETWVILQYSSIFITNVISMGEQMKLWITSTMLSNIQYQPLVLQRILSNYSMYYILECCIGIPLLLTC